MSFPSPNVSVIIPVYNSAGTLPYCLKSLSDQTYPSKKTEIVIVNDGSTDRIRTFLNSYPLPEGSKVIHHTENRGLAAARNTGIKISKGSLIVFLDADMEVEKGFIELHVKSHQKNGLVGIVGSIAPSHDNPHDKYQRYVYEAKRGALKYGDNKPLPYNAFIFNNTSIDRRVTRKVGLFDENIRSYGGEDTEYSYRIWCEYPKGLYYNPSIKAVHHHYRKFRDALNTIEDFGQKVVPYTAQKHSELVKLYKLDYISCKWVDSACKCNPLKLFAGLIMRCKTFKFLTSLFYHILPYPLSNFFVRALMANSLLRGVCKYQPE